MPKPYVFDISGMTCPNCIITIHNVLKDSLTSFKSLDVDITTPDPKKAYITLTDESEDREKTENEIEVIINDIGYVCKKQSMPSSSENQRPFLGQQTSDSPTNATANGFSQWGLRVKQFIASHWFLGGLGCIAGVGLLILSMVSGTLPFAALLTLSISSILLTLGLGAQSYLDSWKKLTASKTLTMDTLFSISTLTVLIVSTASLFFPWLPMMFEAGLLIYGFRHLGIAIEDSLKEKINPIKFQDRAPQKVRVFRDNILQESPLNLIKPGDLISVLPGEIIAVDGVCENEAILYNTIITGSILPKYFKRGDAVLAGMKLAKDSPELRILVRKSFKESNLAQLDNNIEQSIIGKAPIELQTSKILQYFIPAVLAFAVMSGLIIGVFFSPATAITCAISVLVSACPCTLGLITPLAVKTGIHKSLEHGALFKNAEMLQLAEQINTVIFDLNGTLTTGVPVVKNYNILDPSLSDSEFYQLCASLENGTVHPIGKAIFEFTHGHVNQRLQFDSIDPHSNHSGITALNNSMQYAIGNGTLMHELGVSTKAVESQYPLEAGDSLIYLSRGKTILGYIVVTDPLRKDALKTIKALQTMGKEIHLCTGADKQTAQRYAKALGITHVYANAIASNVTPESRSKPAYINSLKRLGRIIAMIGDAGNDAHALAAAELGIAILSDNSDEMTQKQAGVIIQQGNLLPIANGFAVSQQAVSNIRTNLKISLAYNLTSVLISGGLLLAFGFTMNPAVGVALMILQACFVLYNVYQFQQKPLPHLEDEVNDDIDSSTTSYEMMKQYNLAPNSPSPAMKKGQDERTTHSSLFSGFNALMEFFSFDSESQQTIIDTNNKGELCHPSQECPTYGP
ncbi:heavy metal translocating P-type ATPase [Legionella waltersii]|uniref:Cation transporting ATPase PacS n=1 Tax=Legionella waltersii TaxID=66969 RepID=A0A0W1AD80_9GAMM|nr:HAD-IC family P-type ATPase [Legionella waltersii]KTD79289.1 cation transporting ATPase PacS [Legionella waltersii]SNV12909.1 cation transporting ATPase PacS [Legionella waltersii]